MAQAVLKIRIFLNNIIKNSNFALIVPARDINYIKVPYIINKEVKNNKIN